MRKVCRTDFDIRVPQAATSCSNVRIEPPDQEHCVRDHRLATIVSMLHRTVQAKPRPRSPFRFPVQRASRPGPSVNSRGWHRRPFWCRKSQIQQDSVQVPQSHPKPDHEETAALWRSRLRLTTALLAQDYLSYGSLRAAPGGRTAHQREHFTSTCNARPLWMFRQCGNSRDASTSTCLRQRSPGRRTSGALQRRQPVIQTS